MTFQYVTVSCIPAIGHVCNISIPDSFMYTCYRSCIMTFQYVTVSCIPAIGHVCNISIPDSFMYTGYIGCVPNISRYDTGHLLIVADISW